MAARLLLVSDIHGANQYALMKTIVQQERIDAVIDSGDLVNFGSATEADAAGLFKGIASLGVPYLFVKGNHDAQSDDDRELLDRLGNGAATSCCSSPMRRPSRSRASAESGSPGSTTPAGSGTTTPTTRPSRSPRPRGSTPRWPTSRSPTSSSPTNLPPREDVARAGIRVNGHFHAAQLEGSRIGVGTFTGGGPFSHFIAEGSTDAGADDDDVGELTGQPSAFDIATFGTDCRLASLTRYQFRNVIEGRPAYDDVTLINGSRIEERAPAAASPGRGC